jgi:hypothetical protein
MVTGKQVIASLEFNRSLQIAIPFVLMSL